MLIHRYLEITDTEIALGATGVLYLFGSASCLVARFQVVLTKFPDF